MVLNKKSQVMGIFGLMILIFCILLILATTPLIKQTADTVRNPSNLDCDNSSISFGNSLACITTDFFLPLYIGAIFFSALGYFYYSITRNS